MRRAAKILSIFLVFSMCLTMSAYASTEMPAPSGEEVPASDADTSEPTASPAVVPDPAPPVEDGGDALPVTDAASLEPAGYDTLTGHPGLETDTPITIGTVAEDRQDISLREAVDGDSYTAVYAVGPQADVRVSGTAALKDTAMGANACFPSGRGAALVAHDGAVLTVEDAQITTDGVSRAGLMVSDGACATLQDASFTVLGRDPLAGGGEGYTNTPDADTAIAPPWPLGINGGDRAVGLTGDSPSLSVVRSDLTAMGWGLISADAKNASVTAVDSELTLLSSAKGGLDSGWDMLGYKKSDYGSGYGAYLSGGASQYFYGSSVRGATYGAVLDSAGEVYYGSSDGTVLLYDGPNLVGSVQGQGQPSDVRSVFGFLVTGDGAQNVTVEAGTGIHTAEAAVLYKNGNSVFTFDNARLSSDSGVLLQMMDDDADDRIGLLSGHYGYSPVYDERDTGGGPSYPGADDGDEEDIGQDAPAVTPASASPLPDPEPPAEQMSRQQASVCYANGLYAGSLFNGTGYYGQPGDDLAVTIGSGAVLHGDVSLTSTVKAIPCSSRALKAIEQCGDDVEYVFLDASGMPCEQEQSVAIQFLRYTMDQYFLQGHVQNMPFYNGDAAAAVTVAQNGVWVVENTSILTTLTVEEGALVYGELTDNGDGSITLRPSGETLEPGTYVSAPAEEAPAETAEPAPEPDGTATPEPTDGEPASEASPADTEQASQCSVRIGSREYTLNTRVIDGEEYVKLADLVLLMFGAERTPGI